MSQAKMGPDGRLRCGWSLSAPEFLHYHDREWGFPVADSIVSRLCKARAGRDKLKTATYPSIPLSSARGRQVLRTWTAERPLTIGREGPSAPRRMLRP